MATHWLDSARIDGFRNLRGLSLEGLGGINLFVGANNSGKTSVLEALSILCNIHDPREWELVTGRRDFGWQDESRAQSIRWCFDRARWEGRSDAGFESRCDMTRTGKLEAVTAVITARDVFGVPIRSGTIEEPPVEELDMPTLRRGVRLVQDLVEGTHADGGGLTSRAEVTVWEEGGGPGGTSVRRRRTERIATETLTPYSYQLNRFLARQLTEERMLHTREDIRNVLREFDPDVNGIEILSAQGSRPVVYVDHGRMGLAPLTVFGDGLRRAVLLAATVLTFENGGVLFLDEIESGIHVRALERVFTWLGKIAAERNVQIFATTHSLEAVDAIAFGPASTSGVVVYNLDQRPERTAAKRLDAGLLERLRQERGLDVR